MLKWLVDFFKDITIKLNIMWERHYKGIYVIL